jgi:teichuronic acid biosynthesis glycosyltransferase TuaG
MNHIEYPIVTVVMPAYNAADYIEKTIQSVINQTYAAWELIVIDDCSTDSTCERVNQLSKLDDRIKLIRLRQNSGAPAGPRNLGVREAKGKWIAFLDADDIWHPEKLEWQIKGMLEEGIPFSSTLSRNFNNEQEIQYSKITETPSVEKITFSQQRLKGRIANSSVIVERSLMLKFPFNEDFRYKAVEDYHCWLRIHQKIGYSIRLEATLLNYRIIEGQISSSKLYMLKAIFMVHREFRGTSYLQAIIFTFAHAVGGFINKYIKKGF